MDFLLDDPPPTTADANGRATYESTFSPNLLPRNHCPAVVAIDPAGNTSEAGTQAVVPGADAMCWMTFERAFDIVTFAYHSNEYTVNVLRDGALDETCSARIRTSTPTGGTTIPSIALGGNLMTWGPNDVTPRPITLGFSGGVLVPGDAWTLTLSPDTNAAIAPHRSFQFARSFNQEAFTDILFGGVGGSFEAPRLE